MPYTFKLNEEVHHSSQGPQVRVNVGLPKVYIVVQRMPIEADGRLRYRIKSANLERIATEDQLSYCQ